MITKEFGQRLKEFRQETGLSQEKFALKIRYGSNLLRFQ